MKSQDAKLLNDPSLIEAGTVFRARHPELGTVTQIGTLVRFSRSSARGQRHAPTPGEHTQEILRELGYDDAMIAMLYADQIVA
jgi:crotonobetainyl-CoA:carnitine CoA-transferase CaiB-like acyl-CoA transferase